MSDDDLNAIRISIIQALEHLQELNGKIAAMESIKDSIKSELDDALEILK